MPTEVNSERHEYRPSGRHNQWCLGCLDCPPHHPQPRSAQIHAVEPRCEFTCHDPSYGSMCDDAHRCTLKAGHKTKHEPWHFEGHKPKDSPAQPAPAPERSVYKICRNCWLVMPWRADGREFYHRPYPYTCATDNEILVTPIRPDIAANAEDVHWVYRAGVESTMCGRNAKGENAVNNTSLLFDRATCKECSAAGLGFTFGRAESFAEVESLRKAEMTRAVEIVTAKRDEWQKQVRTSGKYGMTYDEGLRDFSLIAQIGAASQIITALQAAAKEGKVKGG